MFYAVHKPPSLSSFGVIRALRKEQNIRKMGHLGTLDPLAGWLMLVATGNSTKLIPLLEWGDKTYIFSVDISRSSPSHDLWTPTVTLKTNDVHIPDNSTLEKQLAQQTSQIPPIYSALHIDGKRAYQCARMGEKPTLPPRPIRVSCVEILGWSWYTVSIRIRISSGGYIRSFAPLIGQWCGTSGGVITALHRESIHFPTGCTLTLDDAQPLDLEDTVRHAFPFERLFPHAVYLTITSIRDNHRIQHGIPLEWDSPIDSTLPIFARLQDGTYTWLSYENGFLYVKKNHIHESSQKTHI